MDRWLNGEPDNLKGRRASGDVPTLCLILDEKEVPE